MLRLTFEAVSCGYGPGRPILREVGFSLGPGLWVLVGPNGAGKSTLLRCAAGLLPPDRGRLLWDGANAYGMSARYRWHLGYAPQELGGYPDLAVRSYLTYLGALKGVSTRRLAVRVNAMLELSGLTEVADRPTGSLSGGMQTRLGLAQALLNDPDLLLLDEPNAGLDPQERVRFRQLLQDLARERIVLMATNIPTDIDGVADGILRLAAGRVESFHD